jgi:hypothetical protein
MGLVCNLFQFPAKPFLGLVVHNRAARRVKREQPLPSHRLPKQARYAGVDAGGFTESRPHVVPPASALHQRTCGSRCPVVFGIEVKFLLADIPEGLPASRLTRLLKALRVTHPTQQVSHNVRHSQLIEVI